MKILVNAATAVVGGGAQVAANFIISTIKEPYGHDFMYAVSSLVAEQVENVIGYLPNEVTLIAFSPARLWKGRKSRTVVQQMEESFIPDIVYSITAPSYVQFRKGVEVARFANSWFTHRNRLAMRKLSFFAMVRGKLKIIYTIWAMRHVKYFITQTKVAAEGLRQRLGLRPENVRVIANCHSFLFTEARTDSEHISVKNNDEIVVFVLAHPYQHKNLDIVPDVAAILRSAGRKVKFVMTLPPEYPLSAEIFKHADDLHVKDMIQNVNRLTLRQCLDWYLRCDVVFLPTLLETFSVTYLEAMAMKRPIITTDLDFAHEVCDNAAEYYHPLSPQSAADAIERVISDAGLYVKLVENGVERLKMFPSYEEQYRMTIDWLEEIVKKVNYAKNGIVQH